MIERLPKILPQHLGHPLRRGVVREKRQEATIRADQVGDRGMIDQVVAIAFKDHLTAVDPVGARRGRDRRFAARQADEPLVKVRDIVCQNGNAIPFRVDRNKERLQLFAKLSERVDRCRHGRKVGRADIRAIGVAKVHEEITPKEIPVASPPTLMIDQVERPAEE